MASELAADLNMTGATAYFLLRNRVSQIWNTSGGTGAFENFASGSYSNYAITATEQGISKFYTANMPTAVPAGTYPTVVKQQKGGSPVETDPTLGQANVEWNGTALTPLSDTATSGQLSNVGPVKIYRGEAISGFPLYLRSALDHVTPFTSGVVSGQISKDGGVFGPLQSGNVTEVGNGFYKINLTSGDLNCGTAALYFTANGISGGTSDPLPFSLVLQRTSGYN